MATMLIVPLDQYDDTNTHAAPNGKKLLTLQQSLKLLLSEIANDADNDSNF